MRRSTTARFFETPALLVACERARATGGILHVVSLIGPGGVHANDRHLVVLAELAVREDVGAVRVHALLDGRDTPPSSARGYLMDLERRLAAAHPAAGIATVGGRYFAMDRDRRWSGCRPATTPSSMQKRRSALSATAAIDAAERGETDEFVTPTVIEGWGLPAAPSAPIIVANFRAYRARQLTHALAVGPTFEGFDRTSPGAVRRLPTCSW